MDMITETVRLLPGCERRLLKGHKWIFSNEIAGSLNELQPGWVKVVSSKGVALGIGYINPHALIAIRLVCRPGQEPTADFFRKLLSDAAQRRAHLYPGSDAIRLVFGESDGLPGLVVDRYGDVLVYQVTTLGMSLIESQFLDLLLDLFDPRAIVFRNDVQIRSLEGLPLEKGVAYGELPDPLLVRMHGLTFFVEALEGQKTGLFLDQRDNREAIRRWVIGKTVLDLFCYDGAWSMVAASSGATEVVGVDQSVKAIARAGENARRNDLGNCRFVASDAIDFLKALDKTDYDVIILDPPAFAKTKRALPEAIKGYIDVNRRALLALRPGGILVSCSCSYNLSEEDFRQAILKASQASGRGLRFLESRGQALDHPSLLAMPETRYLKCLILQVT
jgi:23S rRNA (cytosine1962-C5)-methyltransferase